jgi:hypothetical protein
MGDPWDEGGFSGDDEWDGEESVEEDAEDDDADEDELTLDLEEVGALEPDGPDDDLAG